MAGSGRAQQCHSVFLDVRGQNEFPNDDLWPANGVIPEEDRSRFRLDLVNVTYDHMEQYVNTELERRMKVIDGMPPPPIANVSEDFDIDLHKKPLRTDWTWKYYHPSVGNTVGQALRIEKQCIYMAQERIRALDPIIETRKNSLNFRMGFVFKHLEDLLHEMHVYYSFMFKWEDAYKVLRYIQYYSHILRRNIDITYIVERIIVAYTERIEQKKKLLAVKSLAPKT